MDVVFVSAPDDAPRVKALAEDLGREGLRCLWDRTPPPGESFQSMMEARLAAAKAVLIVWTPRSAATPALLDEAAAAQAAGTAVAAMVETASVPPVFAQLPLFDLSAGATSAKAAMAGLVAELQRRVGAPPASTPPAGERARFVRRWRFWLTSLLLALAAGAVLFLSPEGQAGRGVGIAGRANGLFISIAIGFLFIAFARAALVVSGRWIGRETSVYFSREFRVFAFVVLAFAALLGLSGMSPAPDQLASSFLYGFASAIITLPPLIAAGVALFRAMRRLLFGA